MAVMASNRSNTTAHSRQGPPLKLAPQLPPSRLAVASTSPAGTVSRRLAPPHAHDDTPDRPKLPEDTENALFGSNVTPRSSSRKSRVDSSHSTPIEDKDDSPSHARKRALMTSPINTEPHPRRSQPHPQLAVRPNTQKAKTLPPSSRSTQTNPPKSVPSQPKPTVRGYRDSTKSPNPAPAFGPRLHVSQNTPVHRPASPRGGTLPSHSSPMFFHANEAPSQSSSHEKPPSHKKSPAFFYANGHQDPSPRSSSLRSLSPAVSAVSDAPSPHLAVPSPSSEPAGTPPLVSPPLSTASARSFNFQNPNNNNPPSSPPKSNIHLSYRKGASQIFGAILPERLPFAPNQRKTSLNSVRSAHVKSNSISSIDSGSPDHNRRQSQPLPHLACPPTSDGPTEPATTSAPKPAPPALPALNSLLAPKPAPPALNPASAPPSALPALNTTVSPVPPSDAPESPTKPLGIDIHAEARHERKVLDLEIYNSSLMAINKSLEREVRKQKAELKRFRRMSRAGQFAVPQARKSVEDLSILDEENDGGLPTFDQDDQDDQDDLGNSRSSSPFLEQPAEDYSDQDSSTSSALPLTPSAQAEQDATHRADDENRLRLDLTRHRELLLDTQRVNQSLQRCIYWSEGLIKDGKRALDYHVASSDVKLGGHILSADDLDDNSSQIGYPESVTGQSDIQQDFGEPDRRSVGSEMDSGIDFGKRAPLVMSREHPHYTRPS